MINFTAFSTSTNDTISAGVCIYLFGMPTKPVATPLLLNWITLASVPVALGAGIT